MPQDDPILDEASRSAQEASDLSDEELLTLIHSYENADEEFPEGWSGIATRASVTFELRRRGYDFERDGGELTIRDDNGEPVELAQQNRD